MIDIPPDLIEQLRYHSEPHIRHRIAVDVIGKERASKEARILRDEVRESVLVTTMMADRESNGRIQLHPSDEWRGAHGVLSVLADLNHREGDRQLIPLRDQVYEWLFSAEHEKSIRERVVNDLHRTHLAYASIKGLSRLFNWSEMVRNDGPLSVRRAFKPAELRRIGERAGLTFRLFRSFPCRLVLVVEK